MGIPEISWNSRIEAVAKTERQRAKQKLITPGINWSKTKHERAIILEHKRSNLTGNPILSQENRPKRQNCVSTSPENSDTKPYSAFSGLMHLDENASYKYRFWTISKCACLHVIVAAILVWNKRVMFFSLELIFWFPEVEEQALFVHPYFDYKNTVEHSESIFRQSWSVSYVDRSLHASWEIIQLCFLLKTHFPEEKATFTAFAETLASN